MRKSFKADTLKFSQSLESAFSQSQQIRIVLWLIQNAGADNYIHATYAEIAEALETSLLSVNKGMGKLQTCEPPFIIKKGKGGVYRLNPEIFPIRGKQPEPAEDNTEGE